MRTRLITGPVGLPLTVSEAKTHLRITSNAEDFQIQSLIGAASQFAESFMNRKLLAQTYALYLDEFPLMVQLPYGEIQSVQSIVYFDESNTEQTLDPSNYRVNDLGELTFLSSPTARDIKITFICGWADATKIPLQIKQGILMRVETLYSARGDVEYDTSPKKNVVCSDNLLHPYKVY